MGDAKKWTSASYARVLSEYRGGDTIGTIASREGVSYERIRQVLDKAKRLEKRAGIQSFNQVNPLNSTLT